MHFIVKYSELEKRLDPSYYLPEIRELEKKVKSKSKFRLRDYILKMSSGATPLIGDSGKYYTDAFDGFPFIRVQNLSETCELNLDDCKYINKETHNNFLKRSIVSQGDLLVKITGVGRMAVSSVAPKGFEGNINQHIVVIKSDSEKTTFSLAAYLNTDIGEKLASRRSTGGTRPALDYTALRSIPVVKDERLINIFKQAAFQKKEKLEEANSLLNSIDDYLLSELDIKLPEHNNILENRIFNTNYSYVTNNRLDAFFHQPYFNRLVDSLESNKWGTTTLRKILTNPIIKGQYPTEDNSKEQRKFLQINQIKSDGSIDYNELLKVSAKVEKKHRLETDDIILVITGATIGKITIWEGKVEECYLSSDLIKFKPNKDFSSIFVYSYLSSFFIKSLLKRYITGATNGHLSPADVGNLPIPNLPMSKQHSISKVIGERRKRIQTLKEESNQIFTTAKKEAEKIILGET